jgi:hypothetical protein
MWSRKSAMLGSLAVAMYLLGLTLRNSQLVTIAVVIFRVPNLGCSFRRTC